MTLLEEIKVLFDANPKRSFSWSEIASLITAGRDDELLNSECADWYKGSKEDILQREQGVLAQLKRIRPALLPFTVRQRISDFHLKLAA